MRPLHTLCTQVTLLWAASYIAMSALPASGMAPQLEPGARPLQLVEDMAPGPLREQLAACAGGSFRRNTFSIGHRGAPLGYPEHTRESYLAAARQGAGVIECDVTFTGDRELVCRHSQCDLHTTTDILAIPDLAAKCSEPFQPAVFEDGRRSAPATAKCCTSDLSLAEFRRLRGKRDSAHPEALTAAQYMFGPDGSSEPVRGTLLTHAESIALFDELGVAMTPELKKPLVDMPDGFSQADFASRMIAEYRAAGVMPSRVWPQSFSLDDVLYWIAEEPDFGRQAVYLDGRYSTRGFDHENPDTWEPGMQALANRGVRIIAPPLWKLLTVREGRIVPSAYALAARRAGLQIMAWSLERSGPLVDGGGWYYRSISDVIDREGDVMEVLHVLASDVGVRAVFSDWPATVTYYANCMGINPDSPG